MATGDFYIGSARSFADRWKIHWRQLRQGKHHNIGLQHLFDTHGEKSIIFSELEVLQCESRTRKKREAVISVALRPTLDDLGTIALKDRRKWERWRLLRRIRNIHCLSI